MMEQWRRMSFSAKRFASCAPYNCVRVQIMLVYRIGSQAMSFNAGELAVPSARWLGIHPFEMKR